MILRSQLFSMIIYAALVCVVLALIRRDNLRARIKYGVTLFLMMVFGALFFGWFMYLFV